uniref:MADS-box domain-containing protein n=1 Tax=Aegilops tauschii subsp. strangulata TaxID=200361 RepID=A0A453ASS0_AEGTS
MVRKKVPLRYIGEDSTRRRTYETRRKYLMKKVGELGILCNTKACVLVYDEGASEPDVYPSHAEAVAMLNRYKAMPNMPQFKKTTSQEEFLTKCLAKLQHQANKLQSEREDRNIRALLHKAMLGGNLNAEEVARVGCKPGEIHKSLVERIAKTNSQPPVFQSQAPYIFGGAD